MKCFLNTFHQEPSARKHHIQTVTEALYQISICGPWTGGAKTTPVQTTDSMTSSQRTKYVFKKDFNFT